MVAGGADALRRLWIGRCTVYVRAPVTDQATGRSRPAETVTLRDEPCRLSYKTVAGAQESGEVAEVTQTIKLFLDPAAKIPPGSKLEITQNGVTAFYEASGEPAVYGAHQEIALKLVRRWA